MAQDLNKSFEMQPRQGGVHDRGFGTPAGRWHHDSGRDAGSSTGALPYSRRNFLGGSLPCWPRA